jgi:predicted Zn-dependent protease
MVRFVVGLVVALFALIGYFFNTSENPVTGEKQRVALTPAEEVALGLKSAPEMAAQMGGLSRDERATRAVKTIGERLAQQSAPAGSPYRFSFHLLADRRTVNAFALPGGPVFVTEGLLGLLETEGEVAAVLGHEVAHVLARHSSEHLAKQKLTQGLIGAAVVGTGDYGTAQIGRLVGNIINMRYGRDDEIEADVLGVRFISEAGYDPRGMVRVMQALERAAGGARQPEMLSTHPSPVNRIARIEQEIGKRFPGGVPEGLKK